VIDNMQNVTCLGLYNLTTCCPKLQTIDVITQTERRWFILSSVRPLLISRLFIKFIYILTKLEKTQGILPEYSVVESLIIEEADYELLINSVFLNLFAHAFSNLKQLELFTNIISTQSNGAFETGFEMNIKPLESLDRFIIHHIPYTQHFIQLAPNITFLKLHSILVSGKLLEQLHRLEELQLLECTMVLNTFDIISATIIKLTLANNMIKLNEKKCEGNTRRTTKLKECFSWWSMQCIT